MITDSRHVAVPFASALFWGPRCQLMKNRRVTRGGAIGDGSRPVFIQMSIDEPSCCKQVPAQPPIPRDLSVSIMVARKDGLRLSLSLRRRQMPHNNDNGSVLQSSIEGRSEERRVGK